MLRTIIAITLTLTATVSATQAAEICGNGQDDDADGLADEGCAPSLVTGVCESPLSCEDTGMVGPLKGALHYSLPPDIAPRVPYGPGIGLRRFYLSQYQPTVSFQAAGTAVSGTSSVSPVWPTHDVGDVALLIVESAGGQAATLSTAQGFAAVTGADFGDDDDINGTHLTVFWKRAASSSEAAPTVADSGDHTLARIITFRGVARSGTPWDVVGGDGTAGSDELGFTMPSITTVTPKTLIVNVVSWSNPNASMWGTVADWQWSTPIADATTTAGNDGAFAVATEAKSIAGATTGVVGNIVDPQTWTESSQRQARLSIAMRSDAVLTNPMGERWGHTYMSRLNKWTAPSPDEVVLHTNRGQDVLFSFGSSDATWDTYLPQVGFKDRYQWIKQRRSSPFEFQARTTTGETIVYDVSGRMIEIWDSLATPNKVLVAYDGNNQVSTVTDASGARRLLFSYTGNLLSSVAFQINSGSWTTQHTTTYGYTTNLLSSVTIGGALAQSHTWVNGHLTQIADGGGLMIAKFTHDANTAGKIVRIETGRGVLGWEYNSSRTECSGKTALYFNRGSITSCSSDTDCGAGLMCGGKTGGAGATGMCFRGARCLTLSSPSEDVVTAVSAFGPNSESCEGPCLDALSYTWNTGTSLDLQAIQDPSGKYLTRSFNGNGLPTKIIYGDSDADPLSGGTRVVHLFYGNTTFPGRVTEVRRKSELSTSASSCSESSSTGCARTIYTYNTDGMLSEVEDDGYTSDGTVTSYRSVTTYAYNTTHRDLLETIDGPLSGSNDATVFEYCRPAIH